MHKMLRALTALWFTWRHWVVGVLLGLCWEWGGVAQTGPEEFRVRGWNSENGLMAGDIYALARTPDGFLWLAADTGLVCFDGDRFRALDHEQFPIPAGDAVSCLLVDPSGSLWAGTRQGRVFQRHVGPFQEIGPVALVEKAAFNSLVADREGTVWAATARNGLLWYRQGQWHALDSTSGLPARGAEQVLVDKGGQVWVVSGTQLFTWNPAQRRFSRQALPASEPIARMAASQDGGLWIATTADAGYRGGRVFKLSAGQWTEPLEPYPWQQVSMRSAPDVLLEDKSGGVWVSTTGDGVFYHKAGRAWRALAQDGPLAHDKVNVILQDQEGAFWLGLQGGQLFAAHSRLVTALRSEAGDIQNVIHTACVRRDGSVWAGTYGGGAFCYCDGQWTHYGAEAGLANPYVFTIYEDSRTNLWVGTRRGLFCLEGKHFKRALYPGKPELFALALFEDRRGALWVSTHSGLLRRQGQTLSEFGKREGLATGPDIRTLAEDPSGSIWAAVVNVGVFRQVGERFERFAPELLPSGMDIRALHFDAEGTLWVATFGHGLLRVKGGQVHQWRVQDGLPSNYLVSLVEDAAGELWLGTMNGIVGLRRGSLEQYVPGQSPPLLGRHLSVGEGLDSQVCSGWGQPVAVRSADGRLWFPNQRALAVFDPAAAKPARPAWPVTVEEVRVDGAAVPLGKDGSIRVQSGARRFEFHYTQADLLSSARVRFRYRLEGLEREWVAAQQRRVADYNYLPPGRYEFHVMAGGPEDVWRESAVPVKLEVVPRLWERKTVRAFGAFGLVGGVAVVVWVVGRARMQRRLLRLEAQQATERERSRIACDLHDELGSGLTEIMQLGDVGSEEGMTAEELRGNARDIAHKTRQMATALDEIVWTTNPRNDNLPKFSSYLCDYAQEFMRAAPVHCRLDVGKLSEERQLNAIARHNLLLACKEALHNVVRHSGASEVWLRLAYDAEWLRLKIEDNGRGFYADCQPASGNGLRNMRERIEVLGGYMTVASQPGKGTTVTFEVRLKPEGD